jgi:hypothetical protein
VGYTQPTQSWGGVPGAASKFCNRAGRLPLSGTPSASSSSASSTQQACFQEAQEQQLSMLVMLSSCLHVFFEQCI